MNFARTLDDSCERPDERERDCDLRLRLQDGYLERLRELDRERERDRSRLREADLA